MIETTVPASASSELLPAVEDAAPRNRESLTSVSFVALLTVQFLTVLNDHTFRWLVVPLAKPLMGYSNDAAALSLGLAAFTVPFLLLATPAGYLADRLCKAKVISACKFAEIAVLAAGFVAIVTQNVPLVFAIVALTGGLAALFAPAKQGCIPELVQDSQLSNANGLMGLMNVVPGALGFLLGNYLASIVQPAPGEAMTVAEVWPALVTILTIAVVGWAASLFIRRRRAADPERRFDPNLLRETWRGINVLRADAALFRTAIGIAFFWMLASLAQLNVDQFGIHDLKLKQSDIGIFGAVLVMGVGLGSVLAGVWSGHHVELGIVPVGAVGISICSMSLFFAGRLDEQHPGLAFNATCVALVMLGVFAGLFDVPLEAFLQHRSDPRQLGLILAATNFLMCLGILSTAGVFWLCLGVLKLSPGMLFLLAGLSTIPVAVYIVLLLPGATMRFLAWVASHTIYNVRIRGIENIPLTGGALLVPNHVTWIDGLLLMVMAPRPIRFVAYANFVNHPRLNWLARLYEVIPISADSGPKAIMQSIRTAREAIQNGQCVCIFAEGTLTRTGQMQPFQAGFLKIVQGTGAPVIPVCLHGLWGSIFSYRGGRFFWKWPRHVRYPITILFGAPMTDVTGTDQVRNAVQELGGIAMLNDKPRVLSPARTALRGCRQQSSKLKLADSSGLELTGTRTIAASLILARMLRREIPLRGQVGQNVGIFLPPSVGGALANLAVGLMGRTSVNLNYTLNELDLQHCCREAGLTHIVTSRKMIEKKPIDVPAKLLFLEDLKAQASWLDQGLAALGAYAMPTVVLERWLGLTRQRPDDVLTIVFTSGSTGEPKGVMLSNYNMSFVIDAANQLVDFDANDTVLGVLPLFHCLGLAVTFWLPMSLQARVVFHHNPLDAKTVGELSEKYGGTILLATPTFLRSYLKRVTKEQFSKLDLVVVGAEKLPESLASEFQEKYGVLPSEGYGATETTGPAAVNVPDHRSEMVQQRGTKLGTVGRPLPGVMARVVDPDTGAVLPVGQEGIVHLKGPNIMLGYLNRPEKTAEAVVDGWYNTGDMGRIDAEGFLAITGRLNRFSKIGGEMVPHLKIEEELLAAVSRASVNGARDEEARIPLVVTAVPDEKRGERIVVLHRRLAITPASLIAALSEAGLPNLWLPSVDSFSEVEELPLLGTGKVDLKQVKLLALQTFGPSAEKPAAAGSATREVASHA